ncbi:hypothetical protein [Acinetobacter baumannii]|uniref:hypothetical protein n=1 Tax=Acinetobacter baumannii TaxID=470 RepID=UPI00244A0768|nr:hypothetical protein [Acinetobacter baumannii]MDH2532425.1 hypothetical protein [Acinetobacter baumannii]
MLNKLRVMLFKIFLKKISEYLRLNLKEDVFNKIFIETDYIYIKEKVNQKHILLGEKGILKIVEYKLGLREKGYFDYSYLEVEDFIFNLFYKDLDFAFTIEAAKKIGYNQVVSDNSSRFDLISKIKENDFNNFKIYLSNILIYKPDIRVSLLLLKINSRTLKAIPSRILTSLLCLYGGMVLLCYFFNPKNINILFIFSSIVAFVLATMFDIEKYIFNFKAKKNKRLSSKQFYCIGLIFSIFIWIFMAKNHVNLPFLSYSFVKVVVFILFLAAVFTKDKKM